MITNGRQYEYPQSKIARRWSYKRKTNLGVFDRDLCILFIFQARLRRLSALSGYKGCSDVEQIQQIQKTLESTDYISSEESVDEDIGSDSSDSEAKKCLVKRPLPWRSEFLNEHFEALDKRAKCKQKNKRHGGTQSYERRVGDLSKRKEPEDAPQYAVVAFEEV